MTNYTYPELCLLAGYTVAEAEKLGLCRAELERMILGGQKWAA